VIPALLNGIAADFVAQATSAAVESLRLTQVTLAALAVKNDRKEEDAQLNRWTNARL